MGLFQKIKNNNKIKKLKKIANSGDADAMYELAMIYIDGIIVKQDKILAKQYLEDAAKLGHLPSKVYLKTKNVVDTIKSAAKVVKTITDNTNFK